MPSRRMSVDREIHIRPQQSGSGGSGGSNDDAKVVGALALILIAVIAASVIFGIAETLVVFGGVTAFFLVIAIFGYAVGG